VIVTEDEEETAKVVTLNVAVVLPAATVTEAGTVAVAVSLLAKVTVIPPVGAGPDSVTVPCETVPPVTDVGFNAVELSAGGVTVNCAVCVEPL
jgi:hypothetical protein